MNKAQWLSWLERRPVTAEVESSSLFWVVFKEKKIVYSGILAQLGEHLPYKQRVIGSSPIGPIQYGWIPEWPKGADCKSVGNAFEGSNPSPSILFFCRSGGTGRRTGLKILRDLYSRTGSIPVAGITDFMRRKISQNC